MCNWSFCCCFSALRSSFACLAALPATAFACLVALAFRAASSFFSIACFFACSFIAFLSATCLALALAAISWGVILLWLEELLFFDLEELDEDEDEGLLLRFFLAGGEL